MLDNNEKPFDYYKRIRREIIDKVPFGSYSVLDVGCADGCTGATLKAEGRAQWVTGIEMMDEPARQAGKVLDQVLIGNIEQMALPFSEQQFDVIIAADVLEHLIDPWLTLNRLKHFLKPDGIVILSLPNIRYWRILIPLFFLGKWEYQDQGILDKTHLRFFTRTGMIDLLKKCGLKLIQIEASNSFSRKFSRFHLSYLGDIAAFQYVLVAVN